MSRPTIRLLIIEDNSDDEFLLLRQLEKAQIHEQVLVIADGQKAWEYLEDPSSQSEKLVAIFLDLNLPSISGIRLLEFIRSHPRLKNLSVILMTSSNSPQDLEDCRRLGIISYVTKPVTFASFSRAVADTFHARGILTGYE